MNVVEFPVLNQEIGGYEFPDLKFCNTKLITDVASYFKKHGKYPYPPPEPKDGKDVTYYKRFKETRHYDAYRQFWDEEENKRRNGIIIPGGLVDGKIQNIHITGQHYSYLNYSVIPHGGTNGDKNIFKNRLKNARKVGKPTMQPPDFWDGDYYYFKTVDLAAKQGFNVIVDKTRQVGYSFKGGSMASDEYDLYPGVTVLLGAYDPKYLTKGGGLFNMAKDRVNFLNRYTDWKKTIAGTGIGSKDELKSEYIYRNSKVKGGFGSRIVAVTFQKDPSAARGKKPTKIFFDEIGKWSNLNESLTATIKGLKEGEIITGQVILFGTGGGKKPQNYADFEHIFYNPEEFNCIPFVNIWDSNKAHTTCGFFHPRYMNLKPHYDKDGNSNKEVARQSIKADRKHWKDSGKHDKYKENIAEEPISPSESFDSSNDNIFTSPELIEWKDKLDRDSDYDIGMHGVMVLEDGYVKFKNNNTLPADQVHLPIVDTIRKSGQDVEGCVTIWDYPKKNDNGDVHKKLYYLVHDPYAIDKDKDEISYKHSLGSAYVYMSINNYTPSLGDRIVAKYMGRPTLTDRFNDQMFKLAEYYGATDQQLWYESNRGSEVKNYATRFKKLNYLNFETNIDDNKEADNTKIRKYGINLTSLGRKLAAVKYLKDWLYKTRTTANGKVLYNFNLIYDIRLIKELLRWTLDGNFDGVSAMLILTFLEQKIMINNEYSIASNTKQKEDILNLDYLVHTLKHK